MNKTDYVVTGEWDGQLIVRPKTMRERMLETVKTDEEKLKVNEALNLFDHLTS